MSEEITKDEHEVIEVLYKSVANRIASGESKTIIIADLVKQGWNTESAAELVDNIEDRIEEYEEPTKEWKKTKANRYILPMVLGAISLIAGITLLILGLISPEYEFILPIGLLIFGFINFFWAFPYWLKYRN